MKKNLKMTPEGTKDFLFAECSAMDYICTSIEKVFVKGGFKRVITPALEFYDVVLNSVKRNLAGINVQDNR